MFTHPPPTALSPPPCGELSCATLLFHPLKTTAPLPRVTFRARSRGRGHEYQTSVAEPIAFTSRLMEGGRSGQVKVLLDPRQFAYSPVQELETPSSPYWWRQQTCFDFPGAFDTSQSLLLGDKCQHLQGLMDLFVHLGGVLSDVVDSGPGAPQGTVLSSSLFPSHTTDLHSSLSHLRYVLMTQQLFDWGREAGRHSSGGVGWRQCGQHRRRQSPSGGRGRVHNHCAFWERRWRITNGVNINGNRKLLRKLS